MQATAGRWLIGSASETGLSVMMFAPALADDLLADEQTSNSNSFADCSAMPCQWIVFPAPRLPSVEFLTLYRPRAAPALAGGRFFATDARSNTHFGAMICAVMRGRVGSICFPRLTHLDIASPHASRHV